MLGAFREFGFNPEQAGVYASLQDRFSSAEQDHPEAAKRIVEVFTDLFKDPNGRPVTEKSIREGMADISIGLSVLGDWLNEIGQEAKIGRETSDIGFFVKLGWMDETKKTAGKKLGKIPQFPTFSKLTEGGNDALKKSMKYELARFSLAVVDSLGVGLSPKDIVGGLLRESIGSKLSANGSVVLREALDKPLQGHFEWLREALGVPDVATQVGFTPKLRLNTFEQNQPVAKKKAEAKVIAVPEKKKEIILTKEEAAFIKLLEVLENYEQGNRRFGEDAPLTVLNQLGQAFNSLALDSPIRKEVMTSVVKQLGSDGEKLTQRKEDEKNIFAMWGWRMNVLFEKQQKPYR